MKTLIKWMTVLAVGASFSASVAVAGFAIRQISSSNGEGQKNDGFDFYGPAGATVAWTAVASNGGYGAVYYTAPSIGTVNESVSGNESDGGSGVMPSGGTASGYVYADSGYEPGGYGMGWVGVFW